MDLKVLNEQQLQEFVRVVAEDFKLKFTTLQQLRLQEAEYTKIKERVTIASQCKTCYRQASVFSSFIPCTRCHEWVCEKCLNQENTLCKLCINLRCLEQKRKQWEILCPFKADQFGYAKYLCGALEKCRQQIMQALSTYSPSKPFQFIDDALKDLQRNVCENCVQRYDLKIEDCDYIKLLSNAIISVLLSRQAECETVVPEQSDMLAMEAKFGEVNGDAYKSSAINPRYSEEELELQKRGSLSKIEQVDRWARLRTLLQTHSLPSSKSSFISREPSKVLSVKMLKNELRAHTGDMVIVLAVIASDDLDLDVSWYIGEKEAMNGGRYRYWRKGFDCCMEIFDCDITDAGEVTCIVHTLSCTASDTAILSVDDDDMAGDEPQFSKKLEFEETNDCLQLTCGVTGHPVPYVTFHVRNHRINTDERITIVRKGERWTLRINSCTVDDEGKYVAVARNRIGRSFSHCYVILNNKNPCTYISDV